MPGTGPPTRRRGPVTGPSSDSAATMPHLVEVHHTPVVAWWTTATRYRLRADADGVLRASSLPHLYVAMPGERVRVELYGVRHFTGDAAAIVGRAVAAAADVDVVGGRPGIAAAFRDMARDAARQLVAMGGAA